VAAALLGASAVDRIAWFRAPDILGGDGICMAAAFGVDKLADMPSFERTHSLTAGRDILEMYDYVGSAGH
jgi:diaminohydroxyphosphoribosylaminopyrimidine deaminase/5-amino-6-(5-phosphoribosylamino)uracil reductase